MTQTIDRTADAGFFPRLCAYLLDKLILLAALIPLRLLFLLMSVFRTPVFFNFSVGDILLWVIGALYFILFSYYKGATLGKMAFRLQLVSTEGPLRPLDVIYRETVGRFLSGILCIGYLLALISTDHQAFHDMLCNTKVVSILPAATPAAAAPVFPPPEPAAVQAEGSYASRPPA